MSTNRAVALAAILFAYRIALLGGCAYLVGWKGWSPWWFAFAFLVFGSSKAVMREPRE